MIRYSRSGSEEDDCDWIRSLVLPSSSLLSSLLFLLSSLVFFSIPSHNRSVTVLDDSDDTNALTGVVADELI